MNLFIIPVFNLIKLVKIENFVQFRKNLRNFNFLFIDVAVFTINNFFLFHNKSAFKNKLFYIPCTVLDKNQFIT